MSNFVLSEPIVWIGIAVIFAVIEAFTMGLTTIWFTVGGIAACITALAGGPLLLQIAVFLAVSIVALYFTRPLAQKKLKVGHEKNIVESIIGQKGLVIKKILPYETGQVKLNGQIWTAAAQNHEMEISEGTEVSIVRIEGVKLMVEPALEEAARHLKEKEGEPSW